MAFDKHYYVQFKEEIEEDVKAYDAHQEQTIVKQVKCTHKQATLEKNMLKCPCGAAWEGPNIEELYRGTYPLKTSRGDLTLP